MTDAGDAVDDGPPSGAVILAAGYGRRLGRGPKAFVSFEGTTLLARALDLCVGAGIPAAHTVMVLPPDAAILPATDLHDRLGAGPDPHRIPDRAADVPWTAINPDPDGSGPLGSLRIGLGSPAVQNRGRVLVLPVDHPWISPADVAALLAADAPPGAAATIPTWEGRGGHPILLHRPGMAAVRAVADPAGTTLRDVLDGAGGRHRVPAVTDGVRRNLNTPADLA